MLPIKLYTKCFNWTWSNNGTESLERKSNSNYHVRIFKKGPRDQFNPLVSGKSLRRKVYVTNLWLECGVINQIYFNSIYKSLFQRHQKAYHYLLLFIIYSYKFTCGWYTRSGVFVCVIAFISWFRLY